MLIIKDAYFDKAEKLFSGSEIFIISDGHRDLGAMIGNRDCTETHISNELKMLVKQLDKLITVARTQPHEASSDFIHWFKHRTFK